MTPQAYIAGPYSSVSPQEIQQNVKRAVCAGWLAAARGYLPIIPHSMGPHHGVTWDGAMERCRRLVGDLDPHRDILVTLPDWEESPGAREEVALALGLRIPVLRLEDLMKRPTLPGPYW